MDSVHRNALDTFVCITGASEVVGLQILQENGGDLNAAINAYFNTRDESLPSLHREEVDRHEYMEEDDVAPNLNLSQSPVHARGPFSVPLEQVSSWNQDTPTLDAALSLLTGRSSSRPSGIGTTPQVSHPREVRDIPIDWHDEADASSQLRPVQQPFYEIEDVTTDEDLRQGSAAQGIVSMDDDPPNPTLSVSRLDGEPVERHPFGGITYTGNRDHNLFSPQVAEVPISAYEDVNDVEEEMLLAAIEASKKEAEEAVTWRQEPFESGTRQVGFLGSGSEDDDLARAVSLSLKTAEREKASRKQQTIAEPQAHDEDEDTPSSRDLEKLGIYRGESASDFQSKNVGIGQGSIEKYSKKSDSYSSSPEEVEEPEDQPLLRRRARCTSSNHILQPTATPTNSSDDLAEGVQQDSLVPHEVTESSQAQVTNLPQLNGGLFHADEWGGISSEEHDEAVMLEAALFGGLPESALLSAPYQTHHGHDADFESSVDAFPSTQAFNSRRPYPQQPSPSVVAQRLLREQQDDEYLASLAADQEKEMKAMLEAEARRAEQEAAASAEEKIRQEEERNRLNAVKELVRQLNSKKARLPPEPAADDESSVTLLVRLPDGSRRGRRFQKSDKLQSLFDFIDINGGVNPGTYRLVRQYPRRAFNDDELSSSFSNLGLTNKQEALFLEMM